MVNSEYWKSIVPIGKLEIYCVYGRKGYIMLISLSGIRQLGLVRQLPTQTMAKGRNISSNEQARIEDQVTPPGLTNGEIVAATKAVTVTMKGDNLTIVSTGTPYLNGKRADDGKTYSTFRTLVTDEKALKVLNLVEDFEGSVAFIVCDQDHKNFLPSVEDDMIDDFTIRVGLRLEDEEDEDSEIRPSVNFQKGRGLESSVKRKILEAKARFFASGKADAVFSEQLAGELQMKF